MGLALLVIACGDPFSGLEILVCRPKGEYRLHAVPETGDCPELATVRAFDGRRRNCSAEFDTDYGQASLWCEEHNSSLYTCEGYLIGSECKWRLEMTPCTEETCP